MISNNTGNPTRLHLVVPSDHAHLEQIVDETQAFVGRQIADDDFVYRVVLLTTEAVTNAIEHGNRLDADKTVTLDVQLQRDHVTVSVEDQGAGFDPSRVKDPLADEHLLDDGGRGIFLMEALADEVRYERGGRCVVMVLAYPENVSPPG